MTDRILELRSRGIQFVTELKRRRSERQRRSYSFSEPPEDPDHNPGPLIHSFSAEFLFAKGVQANSSLLDKSKFEADLEEISFKDPEIPVPKEEFLTFLEEHSVLDPEVDPEVEDLPNVTFNELQASFIETSLNFEKLLFKMAFAFVKAVTCIPDFDGSYEQLQTFLDVVDIFARQAIPAAPAAAAAGDNNNDAAENVNANEIQLLAAVRMKLKGKALDKASEIMKPTWALTRASLQEQFQSVISMESISRMINNLKQEYAESFVDYKERADKIYSYVRLLGENEFADRQLRLNFISGIRLASMRQFATTLDSATYADLAKELKKKGDFMDEVTECWQKKNKARIAFDSNFNPNSSRTNDQSSRNNSQRQNYSYNNNNNNNSRNNNNNSRRDNTNQNHSFSNTNSPNQNSSNRQNSNVSDLNNSSNFRPSLNSTGFNHTRQNQNRNNNSTLFTQNPNQVEIPFCEPSTSYMTAMSSKN